MLSNHDGDKYIGINHLFLHMIIKSAKVTVYVLFTGKAYKRSLCQNKASSVSVSELGRGKKQRKFIFNCSSSNHIYMYVLFIQLD